MTQEKKLKSVPPTGDAGILDLPCAVRHDPAGTLPILALGAATGGPPCLHTILSQIEVANAPPILLVQHMNGHFVENFAAWLDDAVGLQVRVAYEGASLVSGVVYVAPGDLHMTLDAGHRLRLSSSAPIHGRRPAIDSLFHSLAQHAPGTSVGVLLTGLGADGAEGLSAMRQAGCLTIAQDEGSSLVYGMPKAAVALSAALFVANPVHIGRMLCEPQVTQLRAAVLAGVER